MKFLILLHRWHMIAENGATASAAAIYPLMMVIRISICFRERRNIWIRQDVSYISKGSEEMNMHFPLLGENMFILRAVPAGKHATEGCDRYSAGLFR